MIQHEMKQCMVVNIIIIMEIIINITVTTTPTKRQQQSHVGRQSNENEIGGATPEFDTGSERDTDGDGGRCASASIVYL